MKNDSNKSLQIENLIYIFLNFGQVYIIFSGEEKNLRSDKSGVVHVVSHNVSENTEPFFKNFRL